MIEPEISNAPPDWSAQTTEVLCPLCEYNLRGLTGNRCPECGFTFQWKELLEAEKYRHRYLFEYGGGRNLATFWKTYWRTCRPRRFWKDLSPAQPVVLWRMLIYWISATVIVCAAVNIPLITDLVTEARRNINARFHPPVFPDPQTKIWWTALWPLPWEAGFWERPWHRYPFTYWTGVADDYEPSCPTFAIVFAAWPWLTVLSLLVFRYSMRQAKILRVHVLRTVVYSADFGFVLTALFYVLFFSLSHFQLPLSEGLLALTACALCFFVTAYRLTIAFKKYLRVHLPFATVLVSQVVSLLVVLIGLIWIADISRQR